MGTEPHELASRRKEILALVQQTLEELKVAPLGRDFALILYREGTEGLKTRAEQALNLATVMSRQGIVINADYMHLTRSITAVLGSFMGIYSGLPRIALVQDITEVLAWFPSKESYRQANGYRRRLLKQVTRDFKRITSGAGLTTAG